MTSLTGCLVKYIICHVCWFVKYTDRGRHIDHIIYLPRELLGRYVSRRTFYERGLVLMVTYSDLFQFVIMLCAVITLVIYLTCKK